MREGSAGGLLVTLLSVPSDCYERHIRGLPPRKPTALVPDPEPEKPPVPTETLPETAVVEPEELTPVLPRRGSKHVGFYDVEGLGRRMARWLRENGATGGKFIKIRTMQNRLSLHRYVYWKDALSRLQKRKVFQVRGKEITLLNDSWGLDRKSAKPKKRRRRTEWFEEHLESFLERDGLL